MSTAAAKRWMGRVQALGCICCQKLFGPHVLTPSSIHHVREPRPGQGGQRPRNDLDVLPICPQHHQHGPMTIHFHKSALLAAMGVESEQQLLDEIRAKLGEP